MVRVYQSRPFVTVETLIGITCPLTVIEINLNNFDYSLVEIPETRNDNHPGFRTSGICTWSELIMFAPIVAIMYC